MKRNWLPTLALTMLFLVAICAMAQDPLEPKDVQEFRRQVKESVFVKIWGYELKEVRFSEDKQQVLTVFTLPGANQTAEVVFKRDDFGRYLGSMYMGLRAQDRFGSGMVSFPPEQKINTKWETAFLKQVAESEPVKKKGYAVKELRLSADMKKALVVFNPPASQKENVPDAGRGPFMWNQNETVLERDAFGRYRGRLYDLRVETPAVPPAAPTLPTPPPQPGSYTSSQMGPQGSYQSILSKMIADREMDTITVDMWEK